MKRAHCSYEGRWNEASKDENMTPPAPRGRWTPEASLCGSAGKYAPARTFKGEFVRWSVEWTAENARLFDGAGNKRGEIIAENSGTKTGTAQVDGAETSGISKVESFVFGGGKGINEGFSVHGRVQQGSGAGVSADWEREARR